MAAARVLLVEDDAAIAAGIVRGLRAHGFEVELATRGDAGARRALADAFDVVVLDLMLPGATGFEVLDTLKDRIRTPIIVLTAKNELGDRLRSFELGAVDFVSKPFFLEELVARIRVRLRSVDDAPKEEVRFGAVVVDLGGMQVSVNGAAAGATRTEYAILAYLIQRRGRAIAREQIADDVLPSLDEVGGRGVDAHVARLRKKLGVDGRAIQTVWGIGYRFEPGSDP